VLQTLTVQAFLARSRRLARYLGETDSRKNTDTLKRLARSLAVDAGADGAPVAFEEYQRRVEREMFGVVFTAHPTFNLSGDLMHALVDLATNRGADGGPLDDGARETLLATARTGHHRPDSMTLVREHELSQVVIVNLHQALRRAHTAALQIAEELYPTRWRELTPRLVTIASWVGYDLDGRSDIGWMDTLQMHLRGHEQRLKLALQEVTSIRASALHQEKQNGEALAAALDRIAARLRSGLDEVTAEIKAFGATEATPSEVRVRISTISKRIVEGLPHRLTDSKTLIEVLQGALDVAKSSTIARRLLVLRAELANTGLGLSHVHVRINASQLHNAMRRTLGLEGAPDDPRFRASYLARIGEVLDKVETATINFGSILSERASARRLFMVTAQMLKYVDNRTPIRFLIAETETAFTVLTALYYARLFGIDDRVDISPLFETQKALEGGHRIINELLSVPAYRAYVQKRGRLALQTGYSDAGRYLGQMPAAAAIERFKLKLAKVLKDQGMGGIELVLFDTHGESVGRGGHPANLAEALSYADTPASREALSRSGVRVKEEVSFQGGDGYLYFMNAASALAALTRILEHRVAPAPSAAADPYYRESDYIAELFTGITQFQVELMADPDFGALLGAFAPNFLYPSGSRNMVRQREDGAEAKAVAFAAELRAIPQNAALQQLGVLANSAGGLGAAVRRDPQRFAELYRNSPRLRSLMGIAEYALSVGSFDALRAYVETHDPNLWLLRAGATTDAAWSERLSAVAAMLERANLHGAQKRVVRRLYFDALAARAGLDEIARENGGLAGAKLVEPESSAALSILHALRVALVLQLYELATRVPDFGPQMGTTRDRTILRLLHLDINGAVDVLERIFSLQPASQSEDFGEPANYRSEDQHTYEAEHAQVFRPLREHYELVRRVSSAITHHIGFLG
jgi:phosphoenolpyruvate carboxylase